METELRNFLLRVARQYSATTGCGMSTAARRCRNDSMFFSRIASGEGSFTARTFDEVIAWFNENWPEGHPKPDLSVRMSVAA